ncbi:MMPL family transporter [Pseudomonadota bacterium]
MLTFAWLTAKVPIRSDLSLFLPVSSDPAEKVIQQKLREGVASRLILIGIDGGSLKQRVEASRHLRQALLKLEYFERVENGTVESLQIDPLLFEYRYLLSKKSEATLFTPQGLAQALDRRMQELTAPYPSPFKQQLPQDPTAIYPALLKQWLPPSRPSSVQGVWFSADQQRALLIAETETKGMEIDSQQQAHNIIQQEFHKIDSSGQLRLQTSGPGVFAVHSREVIRSESKLLSLISSAAIILILLLVYRSLRITILAAMPLITAMLAGSGTVGLLFGELHGITLAFGITLLGVTIDYPIHLFSHLKKNELPLQGLMRIWPTLRVGVITTCIGYLVMATTDFRGLSQLGVFTIGGLLAGALCTRLLLPRLMGEGWQLTIDTGVGQIPRLGRLPASVMLGVGLCSLLFLFMQPTSIWHDDMSSMSALPKQLLKLDREMRVQLNAPEAGHLIILHDPDLENILQQAEELEDGLKDLVKSQAIAGFNLASNYLPSLKRQLERRAALPSNAQLKSNLEQALTNHRFRSNLFGPFLQDVADTRNLQPLKLKQLTETSLEQQLANLLSHEGDEWFLMVPLYGVNNSAAIEQLTIQANDSSARYLQLGEEGKRMVIGFREGVFSRIGWGVLAMVLLLSISLQSGRSALLVLLPVMLAVTLTVGLLVLLGEMLTIFHLVALMLVVGIGIDYSLFFSRQELSEEDGRRTFHALAVCAISTATVFTILASSEIPVLRAIGLTTAIGVVGSFIASMLLARQFGTTVE